MDTKKEVKENQKQQKKANKIMGIFTQIQHYPYSLKYSDLKKLRKKLITYYKRGDEKTKGMILFFINEKLSDIAHLKEFINTKNSKAPQPKILGDALNFFHSLDGQFFLLSLLKDFDDELSLKLLTHFTSKYLAQPPSFYLIFVEKCIDLLGESKNYYSLKFLIELSHLSSLDGRIHDVLMHNLESWKKKLRRLKMDNKEKKKIKERLESILATPSNPDYYS